MEARAVAVSDETYARLQHSFAAAPKQRLWKDALHDEWGVKSRVRYEGNHFVNWSLLLHAWVPIVPAGRVAEMRRWSPVTELTPVGRTIATGADPDSALDAATAANHTGLHHRNHKIRVPKRADGRALT